MSIPTFLVQGDAPLLGEALIRAADAVRILESEADDSEARKAALLVLKQGAGS